MIAGVSDPSTKSASLSGGKRDGVSGPGVGSTVSVVHDGGVGMTMLDTVGLALDAGGVAHDDRVINKKKVLKTLRPNSLRTIMIRSLFVIPRKKSSARWY